MSNSLLFYFLSLSLLSACSDTHNLCVDHSCNSVIVVLLLGCSNMGYLSSFFVEAKVFEILAVEVSFVLQIVERSGVFLERFF